jgi:arsenite/tail-anchored protein-transporting ATPase
VSRIILFSGKGGVGKTTNAAATALACSRRKLRTLVLSFDLAHSLADSFGLDVGLFDQNSGLAFQIADHLDVQEINVPREIERHWGDVYRYLATLMTSTGLSDVVAEECAIMPGMEDVICLMYINQYLQENKYDAIIVDCPPTGESLRFINITSTIEWYMMKRFRIDRTLVKFVRPIADRFTDYQLPDDSYFTALSNLFGRIKGVDELLVNPAVTTIRFVTNPERMVVRETQRAFMYFSLYGVTTDQIIVNRVLPKSKDSYYRRWEELQQGYVKEIQEYFHPIPVASLPLFRQEVVGMERLAEVADVLYDGKDPLKSEIASPPFSFRKLKDRYHLTLRLAFAGKDDIDLDRVGDDLVIQLGSFKRHVPLPQSVSQLAIAEARFKDGELVIQFAK